LVRGSSRIARIFGINPIIIGLTVVAFGTSAPEFIVCIIAAFNNSNDLVVGNILGSNICNIGLILGISALIYPLRVKLKLLKIELPFMISISLLILFMSINSIISLWEGLTLCLLIALLIIYSSYNAFKETKEVEEEFEEFIKSDNKLALNIALIFVGLVCLSVGAKFVVDSAISLAQAVGISQFLIGVTAVAVGTSLPELAISIVAAIKKEHDIILGNLIGSNIFNIGIIGSVSVIKPIIVSSDIIGFEFPVMILFSVFLLPIMKTGFKVERTEGILLLSFYSLFILFLIYLK